MAYYCLNSRDTQGNNQAFRGLHDSDPRIVSTSTHNPECLTVTPESPCVSSPELCTSRHVKKGPPPLDLPPFADVLAQVRWGCGVAGQCPRAAGALLLVMDMHLV